VLPELPGAVACGDVGMRNMSFSKTTERMYAHRKYVTRRYGWWFLKVGDRVQAVEKSMGLRKGEKVKKICVIEITNHYRDNLKCLTQQECILEGFPDKSPDWLRELLYSICPKKEWSNTPNRIEFKFVD
jgi:hypothetical protein